MPRASRTSILLAARGGDPVGTGGQVELLARGLTAAGWNVHLTTLAAGGSIVGRLHDADVTTHALGRRPEIDAGATASAIRLAARLRPAVVLTFGRSLAGLAAAIRAVVPGTRVAAQLAVPLTRRHTAWALRQIDLVVASTPGTAASCRRGGLPESRLVEIPPGVQPGGADDVAASERLSRAAVAARLGLDPAKIWTLCVAPLVTESRLERLLWAIDQLGVVRRDVEHVLVGAGPLARRLARRAFVQEIDERLVVVPHTDTLPDLLDHVRLVWQSGSVAFGGAILDGLARGVPAVAVESDAARSLIGDDVTGRIVPAVPESELPRRAFGLIEEPELAERFAAAARVRAAEMFPAERMIERFTTVVERLA
jgi:glycosyltransferase involved in cell wall biosynthesis